MKKENIIAKMSLDRDIKKMLKNEEYFTLEDMYTQCVQYIKAIKDGRMLCNIVSISRSGMSRRLYFKSCEHARHNIHLKYYYSNYDMMFTALGYSSNHHGFLIPGCGMDMVFHTNHTIISRLRKFGFISKKEMDVLGQKTPLVI